MKYLCLLFIIGLIFVSCNVGGESRDAVCRHKTVMAALVYSEYYPVRIVHGPNNEGGYHCQAQVQVDGSWRFLHVIPSQIYIVTDEKDDWFEIERIFDLETFLNEVWFNRGWGYSLEY